MKDNKIYKVIGLAVVLIIVIVLTARYSTNSNSKVDVPLCENGLIDLSDWDFNKYGNVKLNGDWEFYPNELLSPENFEGKSLPQALYIKVPNRWLSEKTHGIISDKGVGTYRLRAKINDSIYMYGLKTINIRSSFKIFVNGKEVGKRGKPAASLEDGYIANVVPTVVFFPSEKDVLDIIIQVANLDYYNGGIIQSIYLGSKEKILDYHFSTNILETMGISFTLLSGIYYLGIYIKRRQDRRFIYLSIVCIAYSFITATGNEKIFNKLFAFLPFMFILKLKIAIICLSIIFASLFVREMSKDFIPDNFMKAIAAIMAINIVLILATPIRFISFFENLIGTLDTLIYILIAILTFRAIIRKKYGSLNRKSAIFLLGGIILIIFSFISSFLYFYSVINSYVGPLLLLTFLLFGIAAMFTEHYTKAYEELEAMSHKLIEADKIKDEFLINTSHEFKTPLHGIINIAQAILDQRENSHTKKQEENLTYIISIATRLSSLVNDIIDFQSLQNKSLRLNKRIFDINGTVQVVIDILKHMRKGEEIKLINSIPEGTYYIYSDENRFSQILVNLISNSLKYTEIGRVEIKANAMDHYICISIEDTGIGIDEKMQNQIFGKSMLTGETNFTNDSSSGLGLSISKLLAQNMGGDVYLEWSEPGKGSIFVIKLAEADEDKKQELKIPNSYKEEDVSCEIYQSEASAAMEGSNSSGIRKLKILIVDDEASNIKVLQEIFYEMHYEVLIAYNGQRALELIRQHHDISVVLLDVMMPGLSGYEVCRRIRQEHPIFELPVLLLTVRNTSEDIAVGLEAGANDFLTKPFDSKELKARVRTLQKIKESVKETIKMETVFLQSQIKPHFLYNALSVIMSLCYSDGERAGNLLAELSNYLRCSFDIDPHNSFISLEKEISLVKSYIELEKARFGDRLLVEYDINEEALTYRIPALIIQPIVENSIRHGLMKRISGGMVKIDAKVNNDKLIIVIMDNGIGISAEKSKVLLDDKLSTGSIGLKNVNRRLQNEYGQGLAIESNEGKGTSIIMNIPIRAVNLHTGGDKL